MKTHSDENEVVRYFENPIYVPVNKTIINTINIKMCDLQGNLIRVNDIFSFVILTLHFRKK